MTTTALFICFWFLCSGRFALVSAQDANSQPPLRLDQAVEQAESNYPSIRVAQAQAEAANENVRLAHTAYLPRLDLLWQENRASTNNVFGALLPQGIVPSISGPVLGTKSLDSTFGSAGGLLFSWEPLDFGFRGANVGVARALTKQASAVVDVTRLDVATSAADTFLALLAAQQALRAAEANVSRAQTFADAVHVLVNNGLRAGADAARADAELSTAKNQLNRAQQTGEISRATLAEVLGTPGLFVTVDAGPLLDLPRDTSVPALNLDSHPLVLAQSAAVATVRAREHVLDRSYFPRFNLQSAFSGRGTGALTTGGFKGGTLESYLQIAAPFDGVVTERNVDRGSLAGPASGTASTPMLRIQQISRLRLIVAVPESDVAGMVSGSRIGFTVPAFPGENFSGVVVRVSHALDEKTRTMPVELDVMNESGRLAPGMFPEVLWPTRRPKPSLFVPGPAIATTTERTFVIRIRNGVSEWVDVKRGMSMGDLVEIFGDLQENDVIAARGTDELRPGTSVSAKQVPSSK